MGSKSAPKKKFVFSAYLKNESAIPIKYQSKIINKTLFFLKDSITISDEGIKDLVEANRINEIPNRGTKYTSPCRYLLNMGVQ
jgi:hypothetical protein